MNNPGGNNQHTAADDAVMLSSPTERGEHVRILGRAVTLQVSTLPEARGCDFLWSANSGWHGAQRKTVTDFWASVDDGRLAKELGQMASLPSVPYLVIEGRLQPTIDGVFVAGRTSRSVITHHKALESVAERGVRIVHSETAQQTGWILVALLQSTRQTQHRTGLARPKPAGVWGKATSREWGLHLLQGFDGIGPSTAAAIWDRFGGVPLGWQCTVEELCDIDGIGRVKAAKLLNSLQTLETRRG